MNVPGCANAAQGSCPRSNTFVSKETDEVFVITCRNCGGLNVFPKSVNENAGRYQAFLKFKAARQAQHQHESSRPEFSFGGNKL
jgi:hypothetical protein